MLVCKWIGGFSMERKESNIFSKPVPKEEIVERIRNGSLKVAEKMDYA